MFVPFNSSICLKSTCNVRKKIQREIKVRNKFNHVNSDACVTLKARRIADKLKHFLLLVTWQEWIHPMLIQLHLNKFTRKIYLKSIISPRAKFHNASLLVKRKIFWEKKIEGKSLKWNNTHRIWNPNDFLTDINFTRAFINSWRMPINSTCVV